MDMHPENASGITTIQTLHKRCHAKCSSTEYASELFQDIAQMLSPNLENILDTPVKDCETMKASGRCCSQNGTAIRYASETLQTHCTRYCHSTCRCYPTDSGSGEQARTAPTILPPHLFSEAACASASSVYKQHTTLPRKMPCRGGQQRFSGTLRLIQILFGSISLDMLYFIDMWIMMRVLIHILL